MQPGFSRIVRVMKSLNFRSESSSLNMSLPIISFRATQLNVLALLKNLRNHILISVPFRTRMLELFSELLLVFTWSKEPSSLQKSTASMVLPQQQYQPYGCKIVARYSSSRLPTIPSIVIMRECPFSRVSAKLSSISSLRVRRINFTAGSGFVWDFLPCRFDGLPLYPEKYRETHFLTYSLRGMGSSWLNPNAGRLRISLKATLRTTPNSFV